MTRTKGEAMALDSVQYATLGGGCFWCLDAVFRGMAGVVSVTCGYAGGHTPDPTYEQVCSGATGHAEVVRVGFDPGVLSYEDLLEVFFAAHDPTTPDRQGHDVGSQYRSAIYTHSAAQLEQALSLVDRWQAEGRWPDPVVTEIAPRGPFTPAEELHQDYFRKHPERAYCRFVIAPKVARVRAHASRNPGTRNPGTGNPGTGNARTER